MPRPEPSPLDPSAVKAYIDSPEAEAVAPGTKSEYDAGNNTAAASLLATPSVDVFSPCPSRRLLSFAASSGIFAKILAGRSSADLAIASICEAAYIMVRREDAELDLADPDHAAMVGALAAAAIISGDAGEISPSSDAVADGASDVAKICALCSARVSRFESIYGHAPTRADLLKVRNAG